MNHAGLIRVSPLASEVVRSRRRAWAAGLSFHCRPQPFCWPTRLLAQADVTIPTYASAPVDAWYGYKLRLAALARQQGAREVTIQANVLGLLVNQRVIELERTEPVARSSGGVVGALAPYLRSHVTGSLIRRGQANYADHYSALQSLELR